ncbi:glycogen debranching protein, partial [Persicitalea sp.]|uniref:alpha-L-rhamnosidase-related protein n=1 Tax=Persicitalea sp. TaxID=3100273 RepID=UPI0035941A79
MPRRISPCFHVTKYLIFVLFVTLGCKKVKQEDAAIPSTALNGMMANTDSLVGRAEYLATPFVTAGDRVYMIGAQNGQFPDLGWHVKGEMGGVWDHPIKLLDGFTASLSLGEKSICLDQAETFINYPFANKHIFPLPDQELRVERFQFVPDGQEAVTVEYLLYNDGSEVQKLTFEWTAYTDLRPTWLGDSTGMENAVDFALWDDDRRAWVAKDSLNSWYVMVGSTTESVSHGKPTAACTYQPIGKGTRVATVFALEIPPHGAVSLPITIAGSYKSLDAVRETYASAGRDAVKNLKAKMERYAGIAAKTKLTIPDKKLQTAFRWVKYNTDWLVRDVPQLGRGLSAGLPDYPWWFGVDNEYALQGAVATGRFDLARNTVSLLHQLSEQRNGNGRIIHEASTNGYVFNPGNVNETPQFVSMIWQIYLWTGDRKFLATYYPTVKQGLKWLLENNDKDKNLLPDGFGMMEIHGLNSEMIDVAAYTQQAFAVAADMAVEMGEAAVAQNYRSLAQTLKTKINNEFWVAEHDSYADFIGTPTQALALLKDAIVRADSLKKPWAVAELREAQKRYQNFPPDRKQGFVMHHNWVVNTPMQTGVADTAKALIALRTGRQFVNPYGMFVTGIDRDESAGKDTASFGKDRKVFSYTGAVMTLPTGVQAIAENNYGRPDQALDYLKRISRSFGYALPGSIYEVSPDYGMMTQAWNLYAL